MSQSSGLRSRKLSAAIAIIIQKIKNFPVWVATVLPLRVVWDRQEGWISATPVGRRFWIHKFKTQPWLIVQGKSADWGYELSKIQESPFFHFYRPNTGDRIVSVGAGIGTEAFLASELVGSSGKILAIEADPTAFAQLTMGIQLNNFKNVYPFFCPVTSESNWTAFHLGGLSGADFTTSKIIDAPENSVNFMGFRLDQVLTLTGFSEPDLMLMNIEGAEYLALKGLSSLPTRIVISCHDFLELPGVQTFTKVSTWLDQHGYKISNFPGSPNKPWEQFYLYGERDR
jgi:FkbM family methyltransferase